eukprot:1550869-Prorocentrum_lima.AAC.1
MGYGQRPSCTGLRRPDLGGTCPPPAHAAQRRCRRRWRQGCGGKAKTLQGAVLYTLTPGRAGESRLNYPEKGVEPALHDCAHLRGLRNARSDEVALLRQRGFYSSRRRTTGEFHTSILTGQAAGDP